MRLILTPLVFYFLLDLTQGQTCQFLTSQNISSITNTPPKAVYINNFSANKCLKLGNFGHHEAKVTLDQCLWSVKTLTKDTKLYFKKNSAGTDALTIYNDAGLGQTYCLSLNRDGLLETTRCKPLDWDQIWKIKAVRGQDGVFQIQQGASSLCVVPQAGSGSTGTRITLNACNSYQTEQLWKFCVAS